MVLRGSQSVAVAAFLATAIPAIALLVIKFGELASSLGVGACAIAGLFVPIGIVGGRIAAAKGMEPSGGNSKR